MNCQSTLGSPRCRICASRPPSWPSRRPPRRACGYAGRLHNRDGGWCGHRLPSDVRSGSERRAGSPLCRADRANHPQRIIRPDPLLKIYVTEKAAAISSSPRIATPFPTPRDHNAQIQQPLFSSLLAGKGIRPTRAAMADLPSLVPDSPLDCARSSGRVDTVPIQASWITVGGLFRCRPWDKSNYCLDKMPLIW